MLLFAGSSLEIAQAAELQFDDIFKAEKTNGTLVVESLGQQKIWVHNEARAAQPKTPASTFKIPNSLFALEAGAVANVDELVPWDGTMRSIEAWNKTHSLRSGIIVSSVPTYQELARRMGLDQMASFVAKAGYGNQKIGDVVDMFWLRGPLQISAYEQIDFLKRLEARALPFARDNLEATIDILEVDRGENWVLRAKTGWAINTKPSIGWYVGWLELQTDTYVFALNIDMLDSKIHLKSRMAIAKQALQRITGEQLW
ncbi:MAG: class D beta-lactamase [Alphaproteobacteria bacterium]|nr:class D beta-lactamase [Alphaproteobacteria bacterium]